MIQAEIRQDHINNGIPHSKLFCPVALALREKGIETKVLSSGVSLGFGTSNYYWFTNEVSKFVRDFDLELPVKPIKICLANNVCDIIVA